MYSQFQSQYGQAVQSSEPCPPSFSEPYGPKVRLCPTARKEFRLSSSPGPGADEAQVKTIRPDDECSRGVARRFGNHERG